MLPREDQDFRPKTSWTYRMQIGRWIFAIILMLISVVLLLWFRAEILSGDASSLLLILVATGFATAILLATSFLPAAMAIS